MKCCKSCKRIHIVHLNKFNKYLTKLELVIGPKLPSQWLIVVSVWQIAS